MRKVRLILTIVVFSLLLGTGTAYAQGCSICSKTSMQQGEKPARGMNSGIIYLMLSPFLVIGYVGYRWYKSEKQGNDTE